MINDSLQLRSPPLCVSGASQDDPLVEPAVQLEAAMQHLGEQLGQHVVPWVTGLGVLISLQSSGHVNKIPMGSVLTCVRSAYHGHACWQDADRIEASQPPQSQEELLERSRVLFFQMLEEAGISSWGRLRAAATYTALQFFVSHSVPEIVTKAIGSLQAWAAPKNADKVVDAVLKGICCLGEHLQASAAISEAQQWNGEILLEAQEGASTGAAKRAYPNREMALQGTIEQQYGVTWKEVAHRVRDIAAGGLLQTPFQPAAYVAPWLQPPTLGALSANWGERSLQRMLWATAWAAYALFIAPLAIIYGLLLLVQHLILGPLARFLVLGGDRTETLINITLNNLVEQMEQPAMLALMRQGVDWVRAKLEEVQQASHRPEDWPHLVHAARVRSQPGRVQKVSNSLGQLFEGVRDKIEENAQWATWIPLRAELDQVKPSIAVSLEEILGLVAQRHDWRLQPMVGSLTALRDMFTRGKPEEGDAQALAEGARTDFDQSLQAFLQSVESFILSRATPEHAEKVRQEKEAEVQDLVARVVTYNTPWTIDALIPAEPNSDKDKLAQHCTAVRKAAYEWISFTSTLAVGATLRESGLADSPCLERLNSVERLMQCLYGGLLIPEALGKTVRELGSWDPRLSVGNRFHLAQLPTQLSPLLDTLQGQLSHCEEVCRDAVIPPLEPLFQVQRALYEAACLVEPGACVTEGAYQQVFKQLRRHCQEAGGEALQCWNAFLQRLDDMPNHEDSVRQVPVAMFQSWIQELQEVIGAKSLLQPLFWRRAQKLRPMLQVCARSVGRRGEQYEMLHKESSLLTIVSSHYEVLHEAIGELNGLLSHCPLPSKPEGKIAQVRTALTKLQEDAYRWKQECDQEVDWCRQVEEDANCSRFLKQISRLWSEDSSELLHDAMQSLETACTLLGEALEKAIQLQQTSWHAEEAYTLALEYVVAHLASTGVVLHLIQNKEQDAAEALIQRLEECTDRYDTARMILLEEEGQAEGGLLLDLASESGRPDRDSLDPEGKISLLQRRKDRLQETMGVINCYDVRTYYSLGLQEKNRDAQKIIWREFKDWIDSDLDATFTYAPPQSLKNIDVNKPQGWWFKLKGEEQTAIKQWIDTELTETNQLLDCMVQELLSQAQERRDNLDWMATECNPLEDHLRLQLWALNPLTVSIHAQAAHEDSQSSLDAHEFSSSARTQGGDADALSRRSATGSFVREGETQEELVHASSVVTSGITDGAKKPLGSPQRLSPVSQEALLHKGERNHLQINHLNSSSPSSDAGLELLTSSDIDDLCNNASQARVVGSRGAFQVEVTERIPKNDSLKTFSRPRDLSSDPFNAGAPGSSEKQHSIMQRCYKAASSCFSSLAGSMKNCMCSSALGCLRPDRVVQQITKEQLGPKNFMYLMRRGIMAAVDQRGPTGT